VLKVEYHQLEEARKSSNAVAWIHPFPRKRKAVYWRGGSTESH